MHDQDRWYAQKGEQGDVVLSTRVRLARNLADYPFTAKLDGEGRVKVMAELCTAAESLPLRQIDMMDLPQLEAISMAERRIISMDFMKTPPPSVLLLSEDERISVMLCEEDHLRIQAYSPGLALEGTYAMADELDTALGRALSYAFGERLGYLTQCPTNLGTAMRASVLLHLPALAALGRVGRLGESIAKLGLTIRGAFGEGSEAEGSLFQLSNQVTLGIAERQALENLQAITLQIAEQERRAQKELLQRPEWENKCWRAYGILRYARILDSGDAIKLLSLARLGAAGGVLPVEIEMLNALMTDIQPATLCLARQVAEPGQRDRARAEMIREKLEASQ
ncbi:MAG: ATP--guanido phosphotransferase [Oscillospiraceae bacterium]|jgi:protein arginine kinase|nr:ATP--guanido phosphotransferase [Oscillospiraceae bacterium]